MRTLQDEVIAAVLRALVEARLSHPIMTLDPVRRVAIVMMEAGEAMEAALDVTRELPLELHAAAKVNLQVELEQVAATCIRILIAMESQEGVSK